MSAKESKKEEEVDLGSLFIIIGKGFKNFFNFLWNIFQELYGFAIQILLFIKFHIVKLVIAFLIGGGVGAYFEFTKEDIYEGELLLQPNFKSSRQLYSNIGYYNNLVLEQDSVLLSKIFKTTPEEAASILSFNIEPIRTDDDKIELYYEMVRSLDTVATINYKFGEFKKSFTDFDYKVHKVSVKSKNSRIFSDLGNIIVASIIENTYYDKAKNLKVSSLKRRDSILKENLKQVDTLRNVFMKAMIDQANKDNAGTNIDLGDNKGSSKEIQLFQTNRVINADLDWVSDRIAENSEVINVLSDFPRVGHKVEGIRNNLIVVYSILSVALVIVFILLFRINKYLENYKSE